MTIHEEASDIVFEENMNVTIYKVTFDNMFEDDWNVTIKKEAKALCLS